MNFVKSGSMTMNQFIDEYTLMGLPDESSLKGEFAYLRMTGVLVLTRNRYRANVDLSEFPEVEQDVVPSRTPKEFTELAGKYMLPKVSPRGQKIREISFIGLGATLAAPHYF